MIEWIKNLRSTEKGKKLFKLMLYMLFIIFVFAISIFANSLESPYTKTTESTNSTAEITKEPTKELTYLEKQEILLNGKYDFNYKIEGAGEINFYGTFDHGRIDGLKESEEELIRYSIEDGITYIHKLSSKEKYDKLYNGLDEKLFDFKELFSTLNSSSAKIEKNDAGKTYTYDSVDAYTYKIVTTNDAIEEISVTSETLKYTFSFEII